jgi:outer membrane protein assembly factor BamB
MGWTMGGSPAVSGSTVIAGSGGGSIDAYSLRNGKKLWSYETAGAVYSSPAIGVIDGGIARFAKHAPGTGRASSHVDRIVCAVAGSADGYLYCLNVKNGNLIWKHKTQGPVVASPLIAGGVVYCGGSDGLFRAVSLATGETVWAYAGVTGFVESTPLAYEGNIIFGAWDTFLYAVDKQTGSLSWKWSNGSPVRNLSPAACTPVGARGRIFVVAPDRYMTAIEASTGNTVWRSNAHMVRETIGLSEDSSTVYVRTMNDSLFAFASSSPQPKLLWSLRCMYGYDIAPSMPVEKNGSIFFGTKNGLVYCIDARTHEIVGCRKIGNSVINTVRPVSSSDVVVTSLDGTIARIKFF